MGCDGGDSIPVVYTEMIKSCVTVVVILGVQSNMDFGLKLKKE